MSTIAIPIETKNRELDGKLWLALNLTARGHSVVLGPAGEVKASLHRTAPDVYITKDPGDGKSGFFDALRQAGCRVCGLPTEGGVFTDMGYFFTNKQRVFEHVDRYFMWGRRQAEASKSFATDTASVTVTGNPSFDLCRTEYRSVYDIDAAGHRDRYGAYVLFNMNFSRANPHDLATRVSGLERTNKKVLTEEFGYHSLLWHEMLAAVHHLAMHTDLRIVVRPHPSENHAVYQQFFAAQPTIVSTHEGDVRPWIVGATAVVHNGCTTGIESALLGTPTLAYQPVTDERFDKSLPNSVSRSVRSREALTEAVLAAREDPAYRLSASQRNALDAYFTTEGPLAAEAIVDAVEGLGPRSKVAPLKLHPGHRRVVEEIIKSSVPSKKMDLIYDKIVARIAPREHRRRSYQTQKFPGLTQYEISNRAEALVSISGFSSPSIKEVRGTANTFLLR